MSTRKSPLRILFVGAALVAGCATAPRSRPEPPPRVSDSAPDKVAAQRSAAGLHLEEEDDRWGLTAARELRQRKEPKTPQKTAPQAQQQQPVAPPVAPGPVDIQKPAAPGAF
jgi:hypothetical protein